MMVVATVAGLETVISFGLLQEGIGQAADFRRHGGGEEQCLALARQQGDDALDIGDEAHVQHAVGFVDHQHAHIGQQQPAALEQIDQTARGGDQHVHALAQRILLVGHALAADQQRVVQLEMLAVLDEVFRNLEGELTRRLQDSERGMRARAREPERISSIGRVKPAVLPVPVCAQPSTSWPMSTTGIACAWIGVGRR